MSKLSPFFVRNYFPSVFLIANNWQTASAQSFTEDTRQPFVDIGNSALDFSNVGDDGDENLLLTGMIFPGVETYAILYLNDGAGNFTQNPTYLFHSKVMLQ